MRIDQVRAHDWKPWIDENQGVLLDIREPEEWASGTLPGATRISLSTLPDQLDELDRRTPLLLVCRSGNRSMMAAAYLLRLGFSRVANMAGGMAALGMA